MDSFQFRISFVKPCTGSRHLLLRTLPKCPAVIITSRDSESTPHSSYWRNGSIGGFGRLLRTLGGCTVENWLSLSPYGSSPPGKVPAAVKSGSADHRGSCYAPRDSPSDGMGARIFAKI